MYTEYYGLKEMPFSLTPDPKFIFRTEDYIEVVSNLRFGIEHNRGLIVLTGESGIGKTTTLRSIIQQFDQKILAAYIFNPFLTVPDFFRLLLRGFGLDPNLAEAKSEVVSTLGRFFTWRYSKGLQTVLIVDEAHGLPMAVLEEIRLLLNYETNSDKLLQIVLCGQPELHTTLQLPALRQIKQRVNLRCAIKPLNLFETNKYIRYRLKVAGATRVNLFDQGAVGLISRVSGGLPRVINNLCDNALLYGYAGKREVVTRDLVEEVAGMLDLYNPSHLPMTNEVGGFGETDFNDRRISL